MLRQVLPSIELRSPKAPHASILLEPLRDPDIRAILDLVLKLQILRLPPIHKIPQLPMRQGLALLVLPIPVVLLLLNILLLFHNLLAESKFPQSLVDVLVSLLGAGQPVCEGLEGLWGEGVLNG